MTTWKEREIERYRNGEYKSIPPRWNRELDKGLLDRTFVHISQKNPALLADTESDDKGERDIQTPIKPGKYLRKFFPDLSDSEVQRFVGYFLELNDIQELQFANTADDIEQVYLNGPNSCMSKSCDCYQSNEHPTRVYASGDLEVAYIGDISHPTARTVIYPDKMTYARIYGDADRILPGLKAYGFEKGSLEGARILKKEQGYDIFIAPYLDGEATCLEHSPDGKYLIIRKHGDIDGETQTGLTGDCCTCEDCGCTISEDDQYNDDYNTYCCDCYSERYTYCEHCCEDVFRDDTYYVDGDTVCYHCVTESGNFFYCDDCNNYKHLDNHGGTNTSEEPVCDNCGHNYEYSQCGDYLMDKQNGEECPCGCVEEEEEEEEEK